MGMSVPSWAWVLKANKTRAAKRRRREMVVMMLVDVSGVVLSLQRMDFVLGSFIHRSTGDYYYLWENGTVSSTQFYHRQG
jgi:hypothetical protein